ncbi:uncharacterized protein LOC107844486 [Capsicum annuum]|uniref:uncharacterized protein LOC107844486 n=1 Tax=Capsicum annuum TaxID=4072 RepID=UPI001FB0C44F|nr:uncharacterized protein LOC107844486 [Capsicum annuum]
MLNTDGANPSNLDKEGLGGLIRDHNREWVVGYMECTSLTTPLHAEFKALLRGLRIASTMFIKPLTICTYSKELVNTITYGHDLYANLISECRSLLQVLETAGINHIFREQNKVADSFAKEGSKLRQLCTPIVLSCPPASTVPLVEADKKGKVFARLINPSILDLHSRDVAYANSTNPPLANTSSGAVAASTVTHVFP